MNRNKIQTKSGDSNLPCFPKKVSACAIITCIQGHIHSTAYIQFSSLPNFSPWPLQKNRGLSTQVSSLLMIPVTMLVVCYNIPVKLLLTAKQNNTQEP